MDMNVSELSSFHAGETGHGMRVKGTADDRPRSACQLQWTLREELAWHQVAVS